MPRARRLSHGTNLTARLVSVEFLNHFFISSSFDGNSSSFGKSKLISFSCALRRALNLPFFSGKYEIRLKNILREDPGYEVVLREDSFPLG